MRKIKSSLNQSAFPLFRVIREEKLHYCSNKKDLTQA
jgi:hypothetical protein